MVPGVCGCCCPIGLPSISIYVNGCAYEYLDPGYWTYHVVVTQGTTTLVDTYYVPGDSHTYVVERGKTYTVTVTNPSGIVKTFTVDAISCLNYDVQAIFLDQLALLVAVCDNFYLGTPTPDAFTFLVNGDPITVTYVGGSPTYLWTPTEDFSGVHYTISCILNGRQVDQDGHNLCQVEFDWVTRLACCVFDGCTQLPFPGVTVDLFVQGHAAGSLITDGVGSVEFNFDDITYGCISGDTVDFRCVASGYATLDATVTLPVQYLGTIDNPLGGACRAPYAPDGPCGECCYWWKLTFPTLVPDADHCCPFCSEQGNPDLIGQVVPWTALTVNDSIGDVTLIPSPEYGQCTYTGCVVRVASTAFRPRPNPDCLTDDEVDVAVFFFFRAGGLWVGIYQDGCPGVSGYPLTGHSDCVATPCQPSDLTCLFEVADFGWQSGRRVTNECIPTDITYNFAFNGALGWIYGFAEDGDVTMTVG